MWQAFLPTSGAVEPALMPVASGSAPGRPGKESDQALLAFAAVIRKLRAECPWKAAQTHRSLARYLLEETHEVMEALDLEQPELLREELGDLLLQVFLHAAIAEQAGDFTLGEIAAQATEKMVRRNPHVFAVPGQQPAGQQRLSTTEVNEIWEQAKAAEKPRSLTEGLAPTLPALLYADKVLDRLHRAGRLAPGDIAESADSARAAEEQIGDELLAVVAAARARGVDPEQALRAAVRRLLEQA